MVEGSLTIYNADLFFSKLPSASDPQLGGLEQGGYRKGACIPPRKGVDSAESQRPFSVKFSELSGSQMTCLLTSGFALCVFFLGNCPSCASTDWRNSPDLLNKVRPSVANVRFVS